MRIGIMTLYYKNYNYGAQLQSYALWKVLNDMQNDCKQISFDFWKDDLCAKPELWFISYMRCLKYGEWYINYYKTRRKIEKFRLKIPHTKKYTMSNIQNLPNDFDCFVAGSDQIWNPGLWNDAFFLSFADKSKTRVVYAASTGVDHFSKTEYEYFKKKITDLDFVSLREEEIINNIKKYDDSLNIELMPDPTFLLSREEWKKLLSYRIPDEQYVLGFFLGDNKDNRNMAVEYALKNNKKYYCISGLLLGNYEWETNNKKYMLKTVSVEDFLSLINGADLFITDSFHGSVFSCILETPFVVLNRFADSEEGSMNSRIKSLMKIMNLDRNLKKIDMNSGYGFTEGELNNISLALNNQRERGLSFLSKILDL